MIPKIIHYCWFGKTNKPEIVMKRIDSWRKYCPDYQIIEWNEDNYNILDCPRYIIDAYNNGKWAFVTDYIRLDVVYNKGGFYFDTDVELKKNIDRLLNYKAIFGFEDEKTVATGLGFGAIKGINVLYEMMEEYSDLSFYKTDGGINLEKCPMINTRVLLRHGLKLVDKKQLIDDNILILPSIYMCPLDYNTGVMRKSKKTISIHWFDATWMSDEDHKKHEEYQKTIKAQRADYWKHLPNRVLRRIVGSRIYNILKKIVGKQ